MCQCFTCSIHRHKELDKQARFFAEAVYYATNIANEKYMLRQFESLGYKAGRLSDEGVEGEMAALQCDIDGYEYCLEEVSQELDPVYKRLVEKIYKRTKRKKNETR